MSAGCPPSYDSAFCFDGERVTWKDGQTPKRGSVPERRQGAHSMGFCTGIRKRRLAFAMSLATLLAFASCGGSPAEPALRLPVQLDLSDSLVTVGDPGSTYQLHATVTEGDGSSEGPILWTAFDSAVARVSQEGLVTALAEGSTLVTVRLGTASAEATLLVGSDTSSSRNLLVNANAGLHLTGWEQFGSAGTMEMSASGRRVFFTEDRVDPRAYLTQDVLLPADAGGKRLVLAGYGWVERTLEESITRHPYLYGYEMLSDREIAAYLQGQDMRHEAESRTWETMSGIFQLGPSPYQIRMFLNQAAMVGDAPDGAPSRLRRPPATPVRFPGGGGAVSRLLPTGASRPGREPLARHSAMGLSVDAPWSGLRPQEVAELLAHVKVDWWVCGGWAIDLWLGRSTRAPCRFRRGVLAGRVAPVAGCRPGLGFLCRTRRCAHPGG